MAHANRMTEGRLLLCVFLLLSMAGSVPGQKAAQSSHSKSKAPAVAIPAAPPPPVAAAPAPEPPVDPLGRTTPYGCVFGFLQAVNSNNLPKAVEYLDTKLPEEKAEELALQLKAVLDAGLSSGINGLSRDPAGDLTDGLRATREKVGVAETSNGKLDIFLDRITRSETPAIWLFSSETLAKIPNVHANLKTRDYSQYFPASFARVFLGLPLWRWLSILITIAVVLLLSSLATRLLFLVVKIFLNMKHLQDEKEILARLKQPVRVLLLALSISLLQPYTLSLLARSYWTATARFLGTVGVAWFFVRLVDIAGNIATRRSVEAGTRERIAVITLGRRLFKIFAIFVVLLIMLKGAGINVSAMLAGLGIGGIALALAAQKTLEDLFGGISIILRDSVRVGDYCRVADQTGVIEDIGLSSTRLRTLDRTVVSIPNSKIAQINSENFALRDKFWFHHFLLLRYDATGVQAGDIVAKVRALLEQSTEVEIETVRVNVAGVVHSCLQIEVYAYLKTSTYELFLKRQQELLLKVLSVVEEAGTGLAIPQQYYGATM
jgi:MscS family membrane protein